MGMGGTWITQAKLLDLLIEMDRLVGVTTQLRHGLLDVASSWLVGSLWRYLKVTVFR